MNKLPRFLTAMILCTGFAFVHNVNAMTVIHDTLGLAVGTPNSVAGVVTTDCVVVCVTNPSGATQINWASRFVTPGGQDWSLDSVDLSLFRNFGDSTINIHLHGDGGGGVPGAIIETIILPGVTTGQVYSATSSTNSLLSGSTAYWISVDAVRVTQDTAFRWQGSGPGTRANSLNNGLTWSPSGASAPVFRVNATATAVASPSVLLLLAVSAAGFALRRSSIGAV